MASRLAALDAKLLTQFQELQAVVIQFERSVIE